VTRVRHVDGRTVSGVDPAHLTDVFDGAARVLVPGRDDITRFEEPTRGATGRASLVVQPATVDEVREVARRAVAAGVRLLPQGANTGLVGASVPPADDPCVVLSLDLLSSSQPDVDVANASALVSAGTRLTALNDAVARHGLQLPIDLAADPAIGGMIATNTGGNRMVRYGPMRRYVLGVEVVAADADATVYGRLGGVHKDSRGIDPVQLAVGSGGTLGVITRAVVALTRSPRATETWWLAVDEPSTAVDLFARLDARRPGTITAFEFVARTAMERTLAAPGAPPNPFGSAVPAASVLVEWSFPGDATGDLADEVDAMFSQGLVTDGRLVDGSVAWTLRHGVSDALRTFGVVLGHDISPPIGTLMPMRAAAIDAIAEVAPDVVVCDFGHAGDGGLHLNVLVPNELGPPSAELAGRIRAAVDEVVARYGGSYSAEHGLGPLNAERWLADTPPIEQRMVAAIKGVVDPRRILGHPGHPYNLL
jgi:FAD/FMN-containing dehydrogenase